MRLRYGIACGEIISKALTNADISHEEGRTIMNEPDKYHKLLEKN